MSFNNTKHPTATPFPPAPIPPYFLTTILFFRTGDILITTGVTTTGYLIGRFAPQPATFRGTTAFWGGLIGLLGGFTIAFQRASFRLMGFRENGPEIEKCNELIRKYGKEDATQ